MIVWRGANNRGVVAECRYHNKVYTVTVSSNGFEREDSFECTQEFKNHMHPSDEDEMYTIADRLESELKELWN